MKAAIDPVDPGRGVLRCSSA